MKKSIVAVLAMSAAVTVCASANAYEMIAVDKNTINIVVDGQRVIADNFLYNDTTFVPLRRVAEMLGKNVEYIEEGNKALITDSDAPKTSDINSSVPTEDFDTSISVERNTMNIYVNGVKVEADNFLYNDTTYVPLRIVSEMFEKNVDWDQVTNTASIGTKASSVFDGEVLGTIDGRNYTTAIFDGYKRLYTAGGLSVSDEELESIVTDQIKYDYAIMDLAIEKGITAGVSFENTYATNLAMYEAQSGGAENFKKMMEQYGYTYDMYHYTQMINNLFEQLMELDEYAPTDDEIQKYYNDNLETSFKYDGVRAKHVLIMPKADENGNSTEKQWDEALKTAKKVYELAKKGTDFDELVEQYNEDPGMKSNKDGYTFTKGEMVPEFEEACYSMSPSDISEPIKTSYGYHVIKLEEKVPYYEFNNDVKAFIIEQLSADNLSNYLDGKIETAVVETEK